MLGQEQEGIDKWKETMKEYKDSKTKLAWGKNPPVVYMNEREKKQGDRQYDPILQRYTDWTKEDSARDEEKRKMTLTLAKNKVRISSNHRTKL